MPLGMLYRRMLRYPLWRLTNPAAPYEQYYAHIVSKRLGQQIEHDAIGANARPIRTATELLDVMVDHGMRPEHRFVDYGCGSLRLGRPVVDYLNAGNFIGLDVTELFLELGKEFVGPRLMREKRPMLKTISREVLKEVATAQPNYIGSWHVCSKIPDRQLDRYFASVLGLMSRQSMAIIQFPRTTRRRRLNNLNWTLARSDFKELATAVHRDAKINFFDITPPNPAGVAETYGCIYFA